METSDDSILSGYPALRGPVSLIVNTKVRVGNSLQFAESFRGITFHARCNPRELKNTTYFHIQMSSLKVCTPIKGHSTVASSQ